MHRFINIIWTIAALSALVFQTGPVSDPAEMLAPAELNAFDNFGTALANDGDLLAVGAPGTDLEGARNAGAVYLFEKNGGAWRQVGMLTPDPPQADGRFGFALALDGEILAVGAPYEFNPEAGNASGAVYVFTRSRSGWTQAARLSSGGGWPFDLFGGALALQGRDLVVGARGADGPNGRDAGAVTLFRQEGRGWVLQARLGAEAAAFDHFGHALAFAGDELLIGAPDADSAEIPNAGQVHRYRRSGTSWVEQGRLTPDEVRSQARFGAGFSVGGDLLAVLAPEEYQKPGPMPPHALAYEPYFGAAHLYERTGDGWRWQARLFPEAASEQDPVRVSGAVLLSGGGPARLALTVFGHGGFYPFQLQNGAWQALPRRDLSQFVLLDGQAQLAVDGQVLLGGRFSDLLQPGGSALQSAGVVWLLDWQMDETK